MTIIDELGKIGLVPVVVIDDADDAVPLSDALIKGGLPCAEVTFRTNAAGEAIQRMTKAHPEMHVGAGTVLSAAQADQAISSGAKFIVSPGIDDETVDYCLEKNIPVIPGCMTPSEVMKGIKKGLRVLKFFPANQAGGVAMIKALAAPFAEISFMPTGGINEKNLEEYLECDRVFACGGSWMVKSSLIKEHDYDKIEDLTKNAVKIVKAVKDAKSAEASGIVD